MINKKSNNHIILEKGGKVSRIFAISDVHIKNSDDFDKMYYGVFNNLFQCFRDNKVNSDDVIVLTGDIMDDGFYTTPTAIKLVKYLYHELSSFCNTITILGNHEQKLSVDTLSPIISNYFESEFKNYLLLDNAVYLYKNVAFVHTKFDSPEVTHIKGCEKYITVSLYHGIINGASLDNSYKARTQFSMKDFKTDYCIFGDLHMNQYLNKEHTAFYVGSLLQQKTNEDPIKHGYMMIDLDKQKASFHIVKNEYKKLSLEMDDKGNITNYDIDNLLLDTKYADIQLVLKSSNKKGIDNLKDKFEKEGVSITNYMPKFDYDVVKFDTKIKIKGKNKLLSDVNNKDELLEFFLNYIKLQHKNIKNLDSMKNNILKLFEECGVDENLKPKRNLDIDEIILNNIMIYGENSKINLKDIEGVMGVCETNSMGKSTICESISLVLFGETPRCKSVFSFIKKNMNEGFCMIKLSSNNNYYEIKRTMKRKGCGGKKKFELFEENNENGNNSIVIRKQDYEQIIEFVKYTNSKKTKYDAYTNDDDIVKSSKNIKFVKKSKDDIEKIIEREIITYDEIYENIVVSQSRENSFVRSDDKINMLFKISNLSYLSDISKKSIIISNQMKKNIKT